MSLPNTIETDIIDQIILRLSAIKEGTDYYTTVVTVDDNRSTPYEVEEMPVINIVDGNIELESEQVSSDTHHTLGMSIDLIVLAANDDVLYFRNFLNDIQKAIGLDVTWGGLAFNTELLGIERDIVDQQNNKIANARIRIKIIYRKKQWSLT